MNCSVQLYTAHYCTDLHCILMNCTALHCTAMHCTALLCTALHCTALVWNIPLSYSCWKHFKGLSLDFRPNEQIKKGKFIQAKKTPEYLSHSLFSRFCTVSFVNPAFTSKLFCPSPWLPNYHLILWCPILRQKSSIKCSHLYSVQKYRNLDTII